MSAKTREQILSDFAAQHPEAGNVDRGFRLTSENARQFGGIIAGKILPLTRKMEDLSSTEANFIDNAFMLGARTLLALHERGMQLQDTPTTRDVRKHLAMMTGGSEGISMDTLPRALELAGAGADRFSLRITPSLRAAVEDGAMGVMHMFGETVEAAGGIAVDEYIAGNLQAIIGLADLVDQQNTPQ